MNLKLPRTIPDPAKAHGAWVFLLLAIMAGVLAAIGGGLVPAVAAGVAFAGVFIAGSAAGARGNKRWIRLAIGVLLVVGGSGLAIIEEAPTAWIVYAAAAIIPVGIAGWYALHSGFRNNHTLAFAVLGIALAAPSSACAGGASVLDAAILFLLLVPIYVWRSVITGRRIAEESGWTRLKLRRQGLIEAGWAFLWTAIAVGGMHAFAL